MSALLEMPATTQVVEFDVPEYEYDPIRWTVAEFCEMMDLPKFQDRKYILIDGEIFKMPRPSPRHEGTIAIAMRILQSVIPSDHYVRVNLGFPLGFETEPIPDLAIAKGAAEDHLDSHPESSPLFVEVSDSTLALDLRVKYHLYAAANIPEYWVLDIASKKVHLHRNPIADADAPRGFRYASVQVLTAADSFAPLAFPEKTIRVADLLP